MLLVLAEFANNVLLDYCTVLNLVNNMQFSFSSAFGHFWACGTT